MIGFTKERLQQYINSPLDNGLTRSEQMEMARQLLASMEQEPVYQACKEAGAWVDIEPDEVFSLRANGEQVRELYAAPQLPQPAVPDFDALRLAFEATERKSDNGFNLRKYGIGYANESTQTRWEQWVTCRAAMLQGAEPVQAVTQLECNLSQANIGKLADVILEMNSKPGSQQVMIAEPVSQPVIDEHVRREYRVEGSPWIQCSKEAYDRRKAAGYEVRELYERPQNSPQNIPGNIPDGWVAVPVEPTEEMLDSFEHDAMPAVFIDSMRERARMSRRHSWRAFLRAAPKLDMAPQSGSKDGTVTVYPWLVSISFFDKELHQFVPFSLVTHRYDDGLITKEDLHEDLREWIKGEIGDNLYTITFFGRMAPYSAPQQEV
ncbi:hypothetical protein [Citrobacter freundii]|uniref:hypothetical protein n=1 Tax=Citrobacter freundii TaxID=546 RepID=UPI00374FC163